MLLHQLYQWPQQAFVFTVYYKMLNVMHTIAVVVFDTTFYF